MIKIRCTVEDPKPLSEQVMDTWKKSNPDETYGITYDHLGCATREYNPVSCIDKRLSSIESLMYRCGINTDWQMSFIVYTMSVYDHWQQCFEENTEVFQFLDLADCLADIGQEESS